MDDDGIGCVAVVVALIITAFICLSIGNNTGKRALAHQIADGTHTVEVQHFSDGTREVRIVEITDDPTN